MDVTECKCKVKAVNVVSHKLCAGNQPKHLENTVNREIFTVDPDSTKTLPGAATDDCRRRLNFHSSATFTWGAFFGDGAVCRVSVYSAFKAIAGIRSPPLFMM